MSEKSPSLIEFPCDFPIKIMGESKQDFAQTIVEVVYQFAPDFQASTVEMRPSKTGKYLSITCTIQAVSQTQLDSLYCALSSHPMVKVVL